MLGAGAAMQQHGSEQGNEKEGVSLFGLVQVCGQGRCVCGGAWECGCGGVA